jgi:hypothetical protein
MPMESPYERLAEPKGWQHDQLTLRVYLVGWCGHCSGCDSLLLTEIGVFVEEILTPSTKKILPDWRLSAPYSVNGLDCC